MDQSLETCYPVPTGKVLLQLHFQTLTPSVLLERNANEPGV